MKVTIALLAALICFTAVKAAPSEQQVPVDLFDDEFFSEEVFGNGMHELQIYNIFSPFFWYLKAALRTLKGINCSIKEAIRIKAESEAFLINMQHCGADAVNAFKNVIASTNKVIIICNKIINLSEKICNTNESTNGKKSTPWSCTIKLFKQLYLLMNQINNTLEAIKKVPAVPGDAAYCANSAVNLLIDALKSYPSNVKTCSKLKN